MTTTLRNYGVSLNATNNIDGGTTKYTNTAGEFNIAADPLYFVRSGDVYLNDGYLRYVGHEGVYWTATAVSSAYGAYRFYLSHIWVNPLAYTNRFAGYSLRCLQE